MHTLIPPTWLLLEFLAGVLSLAWVTWSVRGAPRWRRWRQRTRWTSGEHSLELRHGSRNAPIAAARDGVRDSREWVGLTPTEATRFTLAWIAMQSRLVDRPTNILAKADRLVLELMRARGVPACHFEGCADCGPLARPASIEHYRAARAIATLERGGQACLQEQREAMLHYRALFDELLVIEDFVHDVPIAEIRMGTL
jgi:hypothetical protein